MKKLLFCHHHLTPDWLLHPPPLLLAKQAELCPLADILFSFPLPLKEKNKGYKIVTFLSYCQSAFQNCILTCLTMPYLLDKYFS